STLRAGGQVTCWDVPKLTKVKSFSMPGMLSAVATTFAVTADARLAAVADGGKLRVRDLTTGELRWARTTEPGGNDSPAFSRDGQLLAYSVGTTDSVIYLRSVATG